MATKTRLRPPRSTFLDAVLKSSLLTPDDVIGVVQGPDCTEAIARDPIRLASLFVRKKLLTRFQAMQLLNGKTQGFRLGRYTILDGIRQDRVGLVFLADDTHADGRVAVKVLPTDRVSDPTILRAFVTEVRAAARVEHPNAARVLDMDVVNGIYFVVSEYVAGPTLDRVVAESGPLPPDRAAQYVARTAIALKSAHEQGLFHRDVKPANLAVAPDGSLKLLDLGLTHMLENPWAKVTKRINTSEYAAEIDHVAPEQAWGNEPDARSDIYGLGSTFYFLLTGQSPFPGTAAEKMSERQLRGVPRPSLVRPGLPAEFDRIVEKMAAKDPHARYQTAAEVAVALRAWLPMAEWLALGGGEWEAKLAPRPAEEPASPRRGWLARLLGW